MSDNTNQPIDRKAAMMPKVRENAIIQCSEECRENYFRSCEAHGGELAIVASEIRLELKNYEINRHQEKTVV